MRKYKDRNFTDMASWTENDLWQILLGKAPPNNFLKNPKYLMHSLTSTQTIQRITGLTVSAARKVAASLELGRRIFRYTPESPILNSPLAIYRYVQNMITEPQEIIRALYLSGKLTVLRDEIIAVGSLNSAFISPREIFRPAFLANATTVVIVHNHPSGDPSPSSEDKALTKYLVTTANLLTLSIQDHVVVAQNGFVSLREKYPEIFEK